MLIKEFLEIKLRKILLCNRKSVGNTVLRNINLNQSMDVRDVKVLKLDDIARELIVSYDVYQDRVPRNFLDTEAACRYIERAIRNCDTVSFPARLSSEETINDIYRCANELRLYGNTDEWEKSSEQKVRDLKQIINDYDQSLITDRVLDGAKTILEAVHIAEEAENLLPLLLPWKKKTFIGNLDNNIWTHEEEKLIRLIAKEQYADLEFLNQDITNENKVNYQYYKAYGMVNEIAHVISGIENPGETMILYSSPAYVNFIKAAMENAQIPYKLSGGNQATQTDTVQFLLGVLSAAGNDFLYKDLRPVINNRLITFYNVATDEVWLNPISGYNDALSHGIGWGYRRYINYVEVTRMDCKKIEEDPASTLNALKRVPLRKEFATFLERFIQIFMKQDEKNPEQYIVNTLTDIYQQLLNFTKLYTFKTNQDWIKLKNPLWELQKKVVLVDDTTFSLKDKVDILTEMLTKLTFEDEGDGASVLVSPITGFIAIDRPKVYVIGLSSNAFSLDTKQSPVLSDEEKCTYIDGTTMVNLKTTVDLSVTRNLKRMKAMEETFRTIHHGEVTLLYSYYDTISLRESSPSVFYLEMQKDMKVKETEGYEALRFIEQNGELKIDASILRQALDEEKQCREAKKEEKAQKKKERVKKWEEQKESYYDVEGIIEEPDYEKEALSTEEGIIEAEESYEEMETEKTKREGSVQSNNTTIQSDAIPNMSSTGLQTLLKCPIAYYYMYVNHLRRYTDLENNGFEWLNAAAKGNLCHKTMERYMAAIFSVGGNYSNTINTALFDMIYAEEIEAQSLELPEPSKAIRDKEIGHYKKLITTYIEKLHQKWIQDTADGKPYKVVGCEIEFDHLLYENKSVQGYEYAVNLNGSIDRMDGYVDEKGIWHLRIIDYKSGKKESKVEEIERGVQIQHYIYSIAAINYCKDYLEKSSNTFDGKQVNDIVFDQVAYVFPFVKESEEENYDVIDMTEAVMSCFQTKGKNLDGEVTLPEEVHSVLHRILGAMQQNKMTEAIINSDVILEEKVAERRLAEQLVKYPNQRETAETEYVKKKLLYEEEHKNDSNAPKYPDFSFTVNDVVLNPDYTLETYCTKGYCVYMDLCRKWMGGNQ